MNESITRRWLTETEASPEPLAVKVRDAARSRAGGASIQLRSNRAGPATPQDQARNFPRHQTLCPPAPARRLLQKRRPSSCSHKALTSFLVRSNGQEIRGHVNLTSHTEA